MKTTPNVVVLALIGAPLVLAIYLRMRTLNWERMRVTVAVSTLTFATVGVGYAFHRYLPLPTLGRISDDILFVSATTGVLVAIWCALNFGKDADTALKIGGALGVVSGFASVALLQSKPGLVAGGIAVISLAAIGALNGLLGPVVAGFTLSATLHAYVAGEGLQDIFFWKDVFEFFEISTPWLKVIILVATSLFSVADALASVFE